MNIPEEEYRNKYKADYSGMNLKEYTYGQMVDCNGLLESFRLDLITPEELSEELRPVVMFIHGGGFLKPNDKRQAYISFFARELTKAGYAVVSPDYPVFDREEQILAAGGESAACRKGAQAVHLAYRYLYDHREELRLDMERAAIMGGSAGGMTAFYAIASYEDRYQVFVNLWGAPDPIPPLTGFPEVLSIHGTADQLVAYDREIAVEQALNQSGIKNRLITLEDCGHTPLGKFKEFMPDILEILERTTYKIQK